MSKKLVSLSIKKRREELNIYNKIVNAIPKPTRTEFYMQETKTIKRREDWKELRKYQQRKKKVE